MQTNSSPRNQNALLTRTALSAAVAALFILPTAFPSTDAAAAPTPAAPAAAPATQTQPTKPDGIPLAPAAAIHGTSPYAPVSVTFTPNVKACEARFGREAVSRCRFSFARAGTVEKAVRMTPAHPGHWRWTGPMTLTFTPTAPWPAGTTFTTDFSALTAPIGYQVSASTRNFSTPPLAATHSALTLWMDPKAEGERVLTLDLGFTSKPDRTAVERGFQVKTEVPASPAPVVTDPAKSKDQPRFGKPVFLWAEDGLSVYVRVPVEALGQKPTAATVTVPGVAARVSLDPKTGKWSVPQGFDHVTLARPLPGTTTLMSAALARTTPVQNEKLESRYEITVTTSLRVTPEELQKALEVRELPEKLDPNAPRTTDWTGAARIDDAVWTKSKPIAFETMGTPGAAAVEHRIRIAGEAGRFVAVRLPQGFGSGPYVLPTDFCQATLLPETQPDVRLLNTGALITREGAVALTLAISNVDAVDWKLSRIEDAFTVMTLEGYDALQNPREMEDRSTPMKSGRIAVTKSPDAAFASLNLREAVEAKGPGLYTLELTGLTKNDPAAIKAGGPEFVPVTMDTRRILMSDLAVLVKTNADQSMTVFVSDLVRESPVDAARVKLIGANGQPLADALTDKVGRVDFPTTKGFEREKRPVAVMVERASGDIAWLSVTDPTTSERWQTEAMRFGGRQSTVDDAAPGLQLTAATQTDRGVYRPGETLHWSALVRDADGRPVPETLPLKLRVTSFEGETISDEVVTPEKGLIVRDVKLPADLSGRVRVELISGRWNVLSSNVAAVEAFEPETMRLAAPAAPAGWKVVGADEGALTLPLEARHAAGPAAEGLTLSTHVQITPMAAGPMPGHADFQVAPPAGARTQSRYEELPSVETDAQGRANVTLDRALLPDGFSHVRFDVEGVDQEGGRTVTLSSAMLVGKAYLMAGWRLKDHPGKLSFLSQNDPAQLEFLLVDKDLKPIAGKTLTLRTARAERVTELTEGPNGRLTYVETPVRAEASETAITTNDAGRAVWTMPTATPGEGILELVDDTGRVLLETDWRVAGNDLRTLKTPELPAADMRVSVKNTTLTSGQPVELALVSPFEGYGLITIEDRRVRHAAWVKVKPGENALKVDLPTEGLTPGRGYVHVSLVRAGSLPENAEALKNAGVDATADDIARRRANAARLTGGYAEAIVPVTVDVAKRRLDLTLEPQTRDGHLSVTVKSAKPAQAVLYAVDEGIVSLTHHPAPDVLSTLYLDRALEVVTMEALSLLMPEGLTLPKAPVWGGDMERLASGAPAANPFARTPDAAAVWTSGPVTLGPDAKTLDVKLPESWHGSVRIVAVAAETDGPAVGSVTKNAVVSSPLMLEPLLPQALSPGDVFRAGASVQLGVPLDEKKDEKSPVTAQVTIAGETAPVTIGASGAASTGRMMTAPAVPGVWTIDLAAEGKVNGKDEKAARKAEISVRPPVLPRAVRAVGVVPETGVLPQLDPLWATPDVETQALVSTVPAPWLAALVPTSILNDCFGAIDPEQAASDALAYAAAMRVPAVGPLLGETAEKRTMELKTRLRRIANTPVRDLAAGNLALAAYLTLPMEADPQPDVIRRIAAQVESLVTMNPQSTDEAREELMALWLLTREGTLVADRLAALTARMDERFPKWREGPEALLAGAAYARMRMAPEALRFLGDIPSAKAIHTADLQTLAWARAALVDASTLLGERFPAENELPGTFVRLVEDGTQRGVDARAAAWAAWAMAETLSGNSKLTAELNTDTLSLVCRRFAEGFEERSTPKKTANAVTLSAPGCVEFAVESSADLTAPLYFSVVGVGSPKTGATAPVTEGLSVTKRYLNAAGVETTTFLTGERVTVEVKIVGTGNLMLADPLPGGFMHADRPGEAPDVDDATTQGFRRMEDRFLVRLMPTDVGGHGSQGDVTTLRYTLRAVTPGTFTAGPATVEDVSDGAKRAVGMMSTLTVK